MTWIETRSTWFCVDIEANGPVPGLYDMVSLGIVAVHGQPGGGLALGDSHYLELAPVAPRLDARAAAIHGLDQDRLAREGLSQRAFCDQLSAWVAAHTDPGTEPCFVGHNAPFDWSHVSWIFAKEELPNPFGYKALCTKALTMGVLGVHPLFFGEKDTKITLNFALSVAAIYRAPPDFSTFMVPLCHGDNNRKEK